MRISPRKADLQDKQVIIELANQLYLDIPEFVFNQDDYVTRQIEAGEYFVVVEEGRVIAIISFRDRRGRMYIETLAIHPDRHANGLGTELIEFAKEYAKSQGFDTIRACAFFDYNNEDFYLKKGFIKLDQPGEYGGKQFHRFEMKV